jgi:hypothetical protein
MTKISDGRAIVAVDPAPFGLAFVFFERGELRDWGRRFVERNDVALLAAQMDLVERLGADVLVVEHGAAKRSERRLRMRYVLRRLAVEVRQRGVEVKQVARHDVRVAWKEEHGLCTKHQVAGALISLFPELAQLAPPPRKAWRSEDTRSGIFDALTLVLHAFPLAR